MFRFMVASSVVYRVTVVTRQTKLAKCIRPQNMIQQEVTVSDCLWSDTLKRPNSCKFTIHAMSRAKFLVSA